ncbi:MAG: PIN domain-containing protein [Candidatus Saccharibacteria bacterium]
MPASKQFGVAILDTNILDYAFKPRTKAVASDVLAKVSGKYTTVISEYLRFEIYRGLAMGRIPAAKAVVSSFTAFAVTKAVLDTAAALTTCYETDSATKRNRGGISDGDLIMGATAFINKQVVITANRMDFPAPYFEEISSHKMLDTKGKPIVVYELKPNITYFNTMLAICYPEQ